MTDEQKLNGLIGLLRSNVDTAREATMTGAFRKSKNALLNTYYRVFREFEKLGLVPEGFITPADENSTIDDIGVLSKNLISFLESALGKDARKSSRNPFITLSSDDESSIFEAGDLTGLAAELREGVESVESGEESESAQ